MNAHDYSVDASQRGLVAACGRTDARTYQLTGQILVVKQDSNEVLVKHEDIPGFMPAMTMPYTVKDAAIIRERAAGDLITATLVVAPEGAYLSAITKTGSAPLPEDARTTIPAAANVHLLQAGDAVPDTTLDRSGRHRRSRSRISRAPPWPSLLSTRAARSRSSVR